MVINITYDDIHKIQLSEQVPLEFQIFLYFIQIMSRWYVKKEVSKIKVCLIKS